MKKSAVSSIVFLFIFTFSVSAPRFVETVRNANIRAGAATNATLVATSNKGDIFQLIQETDKWYVIRMFSGEDRYLYKTLARIASYSPTIPETIEQRRTVFRDWE